MVLSLIHIFGGKKGFLVISGDKGLAGADNHNIVKCAEGILQKETDPAVYVVGQLGALALQKAGYPINRRFTGAAQQPSVCLLYTSPASHAGGPRFEPVRLHQ